MPPPALPENSLNRKEKCMVQRLVRAIVFTALIISATPSIPASALPRSSPRILDPNTEIALAVTSTVCLDPALYARADLDTSAASRIRSQKIGSPDDVEAPKLCMSGTQFASLIAVCTAAYPPISAAWANCLVGGFLGDRTSCAWPTNGGTICGNAFGAPSNPVIAECETGCKAICGANATQC